MKHLQMKNQLHNERIAPPVQGDRMGKRAIMTHLAGAVVALLAAGWFLHDAVWHLTLAVFGMDTIIGMEFSLPDLGAYQIYPDRVIQTFALLFATATASLLLWLGLWLRKHS